MDAQLLWNRARRVRRTRVVCDADQRVLNAARVREVQLLFAEALELLDGKPVVTQTIPLTGLDDGTNNVIQATYWTLDSA